MNQEAGTVDPIRLAHEIETRFFRYLQSTFYFNDPEFRRSFEEALRAGGGQTMARSSLVRGPYLEATPVYRRGKKSEDLLRELLGGQVDPGFAAAMTPERTLYSHQEQAISRVLQGRNVVLATGTGSGKTESYIYPILLRLYRESLGGSHPPGVRALVLFPMNALANDQRRRLGDYCKRLPPEPFNYAQRVGRAGRRPGHAGFAVTYCRRRPHDLAHFLDPSRMLGGKTRPPLLRVTNEKIVTRHLAAVALSEFLRANRNRFENVQAFCGDLTAPRGVADFEDFLLARRAPIERMLRAIVPTEMEEQLGLRDGAWINRISGSNSRLALAQADVASDFVRVCDLKQQYAREEDCPRATWAKERAETIAREDVISFLSRKAVIPKYGFPVDVVELDLQRTRSGAAAVSSNVSLQRDLSIAVSEFAPGSKIIANKRLWTSYGLKRIIGRELEPVYYVSCSRHASFASWKKGEREQDLPCGCEAATTAYVDPEFGFITDGKKPPEPLSRPAKVFSTRPYFSRSARAHPETINMGGVATLTKASPGYLVVLCEGRKGHGFHICRVCGAGFATPPKSSKQAGKKKEARTREGTSHNSPYGRPCSGQLDQLALGHEFLTDVIKLQFHASPPPAHAGQ